jgi:hypothetical protein
MHCDVNVYFLCISVILLYIDSVRVRGKKGTMEGSMLELGLLVGAVAVSATYCIVKCLAQVEQSRCVEIDCCCNAVRLRRAVESSSSVIDVATPAGPHGGSSPTTTL